MVPNLVERVEQLVTPLQGVEASARSMAAELAGQVQWDNPIVHAVEHQARLFYRWKSLVLPGIG